MNYFGIDGDDIALKGRTQFGSSTGGLFSRIRGETRSIASVGQQGPGGWTIENFIQISLNNGTIVWYDGSDSVYASFGGAIVMIAGPFSVIDGEVVRNARTWRWGRDGNTVAIAVTFMNDFPNNRNQAIYLVTLPCAPDFDGDGFVTGADFDQFVQAYEAGDMEADFDEDGFLTGADFDSFVQTFETGCGVQ